MKWCGKVRRRVRKILSSRQANWFDKNSKFGFFKDHGTPNGPTMFDIGANLIPNFSLISDSLNQIHTVLLQ